MRRCHELEIGHVYDLNDDEVDNGSFLFKSTQMFIYCKLFRRSFINTFLFEEVILRLAA